MSASVSLKQRRDSSVLCRCCDGETCLGLRVLLCMVLTDAGLRCGCVRICDSGVGVGVGLGLCWGVGVGVGLGLVGSGLRGRVGSGAVGLVVVY